MGAPLDPPPWHTIGSLLTAAAAVYAVLFGLAVVMSFLHRSAILKQIYPFTDQTARLRSIVSEFISRNALLLSMIHITLSTTVCVLYVFITYLGNVPLTLRIIQAGLGILFFTRLLFKIICSMHPIALVVGPESVMDVISLSSLVFAGQDAWLNFSFLQAYIALARYFHIESFLEALFMQKTSPFRRQLARLALEFIAFVYVFACGLQLFEVLGDPTENLAATTFELTLANSLYFTVVTIFTVGYGDFVPYTLFGRLWIIFIIVVGAILVTRKIGQVIDVVSSMRRGMGSFVKDEGVDHCVLCGNIKWEYLKTFVQEFYAEERNIDTKVVVICDNPNWTEVVWNKFIATQAPYRHNVVYLEGTCMTRDDLLRAQVETALAIFVLCNQHDPNPFLEDSETLKRILTLRTYAPSTPIYAMCALRDSMLQITVALEHQDGTSSERAQCNRRDDLFGMYESFGRMRQIGANERVGIFRSADDDQAHSSQSQDCRSNLNKAHYSKAASQNHRLPSGLACDDGDDVGDDVGDDDDDDDDDFMLVSDYDCTSDLKSDALCMQEAEMSLLAENVFCNGLSTMLSNLILNVLPQAKQADRPWMVEYKIGAECRLAYVKLPMDLQNWRFSRIAVILYDYGILLLATKRFGDNKWRPVTPHTVINLNTIGLIVTFHSDQFVEKVLAHATDYLCNDDSESSEYSSSHSAHSVPSVSGNDVSRTDHSAKKERRQERYGRDLESSAPFHGARGETLGENIETREFDDDFPRRSVGDGTAQTLPDLPVLLDLPDAVMSTDTLASRSIDADLIENDDSIAAQSSTLPGLVDSDPSEELHRMLGDVVARHVSSSHARAPDSESRGKAEADASMDGVDKRQVFPSSGRQSIKDVAESTAHSKAKGDGSGGSSISLLLGEERHPSQLGEFGTGVFDKDSKVPSSSLHQLREDHSRADDLDAVADVLLGDADEIVLPHASADATSLSYDGLERQHTSTVAPGDQAGRLARKASSVSEEGRSVARRSSFSPGIASVKRGATISGTPSMGAADVPKREGSRVSFPVYADVKRSKRPASTIGKLDSDIEEHEKLTSRPLGQINELKAGEDTGNVFFGDCPLPARLKNHIVVCVIGQMGVVNLKYFLDRVWMRRRGSRRETPVVAICPKITVALQDDISLFSSNRLYVLQGNSLSIGTLKRAQFDRARAIVVLACEDKNDLDHMDAKAIFTIMTLDYMLGESSNTFVCAMLDAEESMQLLRAPAHPRRRGVDLGSVTDEQLLFGKNLRSASVSDPRRSLSWMSGSNVLQSPRARQFPLNAANRPGLSAIQHPDQAGAAGLSSRTGNPSNSAHDFRRGDTFLSFGGQSLNSFADGAPSTTMTPYIGGQSHLWSDRSIAVQDVVSGVGESYQVRNTTGAGGRRLPISQSFSFIPRVDDEANLPLSTAGRGTSALNFLFTSPSHVGTDQMGTGMSGIYGDARNGLTANDRNMSFATGVFPENSAQGPLLGGQIRDELFERQRYASGEMMISSVYVALLIREFAMPGIMSVIRRIFGAGVGKNTRSRKCWIRTQKIPQSWIARGENGQRTYRDLFEVLVTLGCIPLGLYRSGEATIRVQLAVDNDSRGSLPVSPPADESQQAIPRLPVHEGEVQVDDLANEVDELRALFPEGLMSPRPLQDTQSYRCPTTGRVATFEQVMSGDNVLPYVYTNPEPYTLVSEHDAVYILAHPHVRIKQDDW